LIKRFWTSGSAEWVCEKTVSSPKRGFFDAPPAALDDEEEEEEEN
jgi:hypothetical protein